MSEGYDEEIVEWLRRSREQIGELEPVYITPEGEVLDGKHRLKAYPGWKTKTLEVEGSQKIIQRIHRNIHRRLGKRELKEAIIQLAAALEREGVQREHLIDEIKKVLPFSEDYIRKMLPARFKRKYRKKLKPAYRTLVEKEVKPKAKPELKKKEEKFLICPVCGSKLKLKGDMLYPIK